MGVTIEYGQEVVHIHAHDKMLRTRRGRYHYGFLCNAGGVYADRIAHHFGVGLHYRILH